MQNNHYNYIIANKTVYNVFFKNLFYLQMSVGEENSKSLRQCTPMCKCGFSNSVDLEFDRF